MYSLSDESHSYPLSNYNQSPSFLSIQESSSINTFFPQQHHHHQNLLNGPYNHLSPLLNPPISEYPINNLTTNLLLEEAPNDPENPMNFPSNMGNNKVSSTKRGAPAGRKDRHTKISTAQGLRDRRVRLSISIARDFFSLQDMLGFDKASKTLGWLMGKCKVAIDELSCTSKINSELQVVVAQGLNKEKEEEEEQQVLLNNGKLSKKKRGRRSENIVCKGDEEVASREVMRAKARERARERTKNKKKMMSIDHNSNQIMEQHNLIICQPSSTAAQHTTSSYGRESGGISKSKLRGSSSLYNHEMSSKDNYDESSTSNYYNDYITRLALEGNNGGIIRPPGFSTLNIINLSTAIHINAKPWETSANQIPQ